MMMVLRNFLWLLCVGGAAAQSPEISFSREIAPILVTQCLACHNADKAKGGYRMHTFDALGLAGKSGEVPLVPNQPGQSELYKRLVTSDAEDRMPQEADALPEEQVGLIRRWIEQGANLDAGDGTALLAGLVPRAPHPAPPERYQRAVPILSLAFDPAGTRLAVGGFHEVSFWTRTGDLIGRLTNVPQRVQSLAFSPANTNIHTPARLALAGGKPGRAGEISVYDLASLSLETNLVRAPDEMLAVLFSADGSRLVGAGTDNTIHVFDAHTWQRVAAIQQHADWVTALALSADGAQVASASRDRTARVYQTGTGILETTYVGHSSLASAIAFLPGGLLASGGRERSVHIWERAEGHKKGEISGLVPDVQEMLSAGENLFVAGSDRTVRQYRAADRTWLRTFPDHSGVVFALALSPAGDVLAAGCQDGSIKLWNVADGQLLATFLAAPGLVTDAVR